jgi:hypothetical protein
MALAQILVNAKNAVVGTGPQLSEENYHVRKTNNSSCAGAKATFVSYF